MGKLKATLPWIALGASTMTGITLGAYAAVRFTKTVMTTVIPSDLPWSQKVMIIARMDKKATVAAVGAVTIPVATLAIVSRHVSTSIAATTATAALATTGAQALREAVQAHAPEQADAIFRQANSKTEAYRQQVTGTVNRKVPVAIGEGPAILPEWTGLGNELMIFARSRRPFYCCAEAVEKAFAQASMKAMQEGGYATYNDVYDLLNLTETEEGGDRRWNVCDQGEWRPTISATMVDGSAILTVSCDDETVY